MKVRWTRFCVALLVLFIPLHFASCSSTQQQEDWDTGELNNEWDDPAGNEWNEYENEWDGNNEYGWEEDPDGDEWNSYNEFGEFGAEGNGFDEGFDEFLGGNEFSFQEQNNDLSSILSEMDQVDPGMDGVTNAEAGFNDMYQDTGYGALTEVNQGIDPGFADMPMDQAMVSASPALPEYGSKMPYIVKRGDTLVKIATKIYGNSTRWREIADLSSLANPSRIYPGDVVYYQLTDESMNFATVYESLPRQEIVVNAGDTLSTIAGRVFGDATNWKAIWRQNDNISNPDRLETGMVLHYVVPGSLTAALGSSFGVAVAAVQDVLVHTVEVAQVQLETTPEKGMSDMMAMITKALNVNVLG